MRDTRSRPSTTGRSRRPTTCWRACSNDSRSRTSRTIRSSSCSPTTARSSGSTARCSTRTRSTRSCCTCPCCCAFPPGASRARRVDARVSMLDVLPTVLELLAVPAPKSSARALAGAAHARRAAPRGADRGRGLPLRAEPPVGDPRRLESSCARFPPARSSSNDLASDPGEQRDLSAVRPEQRDRLLDVLRGQLPAPATAPDPEVQRFEGLPEADRQRLRELGYID